METLEPQKDSFITKDLKEMFADLLFKVSINNNEGYVYFLFEHKSYRDKLAVFQLLKYMIEIWESKIINGNAHELPVIIPLLIYHDKGEWGIQTSLGEMIAGYHTLSEEIKRYIPNYEYIVYNLAKYRDEDIKGAVMTQIVIKVMPDVKHASRDQIISIAEEISKLAEEMRNQGSASQIVVACLRYILSIRDDISKDDLIQIAGRISMEGRELVMIAAQQLLEEGREEEKYKMAKRAILKGMSNKDILDITELTEEDIEKTRKEI